MASMSHSIDHIWKWKMAVDITAGTEHYPSAMETGDLLWMWIICFSATFSSLDPLKQKGFLLPIFSMGVQVQSRKAAGIKYFTVEERHFTMKIIVWEYLCFSFQPWGRLSSQLIRNISMLTQQSRVGPQGIQTCLHSSVYMSLCVYKWNKLFFSATFLSFMQPSSFTMITSIYCN